MHAARQEFWGILFIVVGILLLLDSLGYASFGYLVRAYWPVILVLLGVWLLVRSEGPVRRRRKTESGQPGAVQSDEAVFGDVREETSASSVRHSTVFGDLDIRVTSQAFTGGSVTTVFGDLRLDMHTVALAPGEQRLNISGVFGDVELTVPLGAEYRFEGSMLMGDVTANGQRKSGFGPDLKTETPGFAAASQRIVIRASGVFGSITVH